MQIVKILSTEHSVDTATLAASIAEASEEDFAALVAVLSGVDKEMARRAAWAFGKAGEKRPEWAELHMEGLLELLADKAHPALHRNIYRVLQYMEVPADYHASLFDLCLKELHDPKRPAAIKVFAMTVAANISSRQPELTTELKLSIQENIPYGSAGFRNRAGKILRNLK
jgi:HEAT repeat protein